jgi:hypothetical protein
LQALFDDLLEVLTVVFCGRSNSGAAVEVDAADVVGGALIGRLQRLGGDDFVHDLMQLADDVADVGFVAVFLQALVDDIQRVAGGALSVDAFDVHAGDEFLEDFAAHHFEAFAGFIVFVGCFLGFSDGGVTREACQLDDVVQGGAALG